MTAAHAASQAHRNGAVAPLITASRVTILSGVVPTTLVRDIDLTIGTKQCVAITGPSARKSSLLYPLGLPDCRLKARRIGGRATAHMDEAEPR
jgi:hypothetical protein